MTEYRIEYSIKRMTDEDDDFVEIGFGSSGACETIEDATYALESLVSRGEWETEGDMPTPESVLEDISEAEEAEFG